MAAETKSGFMIDGNLYELPSLETFTMDEAQVLYDYSGLTIEDFAPPEGVEPDEKGEYEFDDEQKAKLKNPGFTRALLHIAYQRGNPRLAAHKVKTLVGNANLLDVLDDFASSKPKDDAVPLELTKQPSEQSPSGSDTSRESSGSGSITSSDGQVVPLTPTTTPGLDTSSTPSPQEASEA